MDKNSISNGAANLARKMCSTERSRVFSIEEIGSLLKTSAAIRKDLDMIVELSLLTGIRIGEVVNIQFDDIDFANKTITISKAGKGYRSRLIPVGSRVVQILRYLQHSHGKPVPYSKQTLQRSFARVREANGVPGSFHVLRWSSYAWYYMYGRIPSSIISGVFGHTPTCADTVISTWSKDSAAQELFRRAQDKFASLLH